MTLDQQIKIVGLMATSSAAILEKIHAGDILGAQLEAENLQTEAQDWAWHVANEARQRGPRMTMHEEIRANDALRQALKELYHTTAAARFDLAADRPALLERSIFKANACALSKAEKILGRHLPMQPNP